MGLLCTWPMSLLHPGRLNPHITPDAIPYTRTQMNCMVPFHEGIHHRIRQPLHQAEVSNTVVDVLMRLACKEEGETLLDTFNMQGIVTWKI